MHRPFPYQAAEYLATRCILPQAADGTKRITGLSASALEHSEHPPALVFARPSPPWRIASRRPLRKRCASSTNGLVVELMSEYLAMPCISQPGRDRSTLHCGGFVRMDMDRKCTAWRGVLRPLPWSGVPLRPCAPEPAYRNADSDFGWGIVKPECAPERIIFSLRPSF